jgi:hypothetical protein
MPVEISNSREASVGSYVAFWYLWQWFLEEYSSHYVGRELCILTFRVSIDDDLFISQIQFEISSIVPT